MVYLLDTNIFLRALVEVETEVKAECVKLLELVKSGEIDAVVSSLVLAEMVWTLQSFYGVDRVKSAEVVQKVINLRGLKVIDGYEVIRALDLFASKKVKFIDAMLASIRKVADKEWIVVSYDKDFDNLGVTRKEPGEIVVGVGSEK